MARRRGDKSWYSLLCMGAHRPSCGVSVSLFDASCLALRVPSIRQQRGGCPEGRWSGARGQSSARSVVRRSSGKASRRGSWRRTRRWRRRRASWSIRGCLCVGGGSGRGCSGGRGWQSARKAVGEASRRGGRGLLCARGRRGRGGRWRGGGARRWGEEAGQGQGRARQRQRQRRRRRQAREEERT